MPNPMKGEAAVTLEDGREFILVLDFEALIEAESLYGKPLDQVMSDARLGFYGANRALLYGALKGRQPRLTPRDATDMLQTDGERVLAALEHAATLALPEGKGDKDGARPRGNNSGSSGAKPGKKRKPSGAKPRAPSR